MRVEKWCGHDIHFVNIRGEWYAALKDICDVLKLEEIDVIRYFSDVIEYNLLITIPENDETAISYVGILEVMYGVIDSHEQRKQMYTDIKHIFDSF